MSIKVLDQHSIRNLHSGQVIVDLESITKELIENSLDAHATSIELVFINSGLESLQVKDNGDGIDEKDRQCVAKQHYTSKIKQFKDLESIQTFGFRGEAMNSICNSCDKLVITTKTKQDMIAKQYDVDKLGDLSNEKPVNTIAKSGTIIQLYKPFYNLPVRRQLAQKNAAPNMKKIQELLIKYALAHPHVRFSSQQKSDTAGEAHRNNSSNYNDIWIKPVTSSVTNTLGILFGGQLNDMLERFIETDPEHKDLTVDIILPKSNSDASIILKGPDRLYFYVNQRLINYVKSELKEIVSTIRTRYYEAIGLQSNNKKLPFIYIDIQIPPNQYDINVEPNKTTVLFHEKQRIVSLIEKVLDKVYPSKSTHFFAVNSSINNTDSIVVTTSQPTIPSDKPIPVNVAQEQVQEEPLFVQNNNSPIVPTTKQYSALEQQQNNWAFSMMDDDELMSDDDDDDTSSVVAKSSIKATSSASSNRTGITGEKKTNLPPQQQQLQPQLRHTFLQQPSFTNSPASKHAVTADDASAKTIPAGLEDWQIDAGASTIVEITAAVAADPKRTITNVVSPINHVSTLSAINNQQALQLGHQSSPTDIVPRMPEKMTPKKRPIQLEDEEEEEAARTTPKIQKQQQSGSLSPSRQMPPLAHNSSSSPSSPSPSSSSSSLSLSPPPPRRRRDIPSLFNMSSSQQQGKINNDLTNTLNQAIRIDCSFEEDIKAKYRIRKEILAETSRIRLSDYLQINDYQKGQITSLLKDSTGRLGAKGLAFYTRGNPSTFDKCRHQIVQLGVVQLEQLTIESITNRLAREYKLIVKKFFERPVQIQISHQDRLCPILISLKSKEQFIQDDMHGLQSVTYRDIIDENVLFNGFRARWRNDVVSGNFVVQLTGVYSLGSGYGTGDFREILALIAEAAAKSATEKVSSGQNVPTGLVRPTKVMHHVRRLAEEIYLTKKQEEDQELKELERALDGLKWKEGQEGDRPVWKLGYAASAPDKVLACALVSSSGGAGGTEQ